MARSQPLETRFWSKVDRRGPNECWPWRGCTNQKGYGRIYAGDRQRPVQQISWELANKAPFPSGKMGCHSCDNRICVNPSHIWVGTSLDNARDCVAKGRWRLAGSTHCARGHEYTLENTGYRRGPKGHRICRTCVRQRLARSCSEVKGLLNAARAFLNASERSGECSPERARLASAVQALSGVIS